MSIAQAAELHGVSAWSGSMWWKQSGVMGLRGHAGGGLPGSAPAAVSGSGTVRRVLTGEDRAAIAAGLRARWSYRRIGEAIGRDPSVVCRELNRNRGADGSYTGAVAHRAAHERRRRPRSSSWR
jgi:transposase, IS30 family